MCVTTYSEFKQCVCMLSRWLLEKDRALDETLKFYKILDTTSADVIEKKYLGKGRVYVLSDDYKHARNCKTGKKIKIDSSTAYDKLPALFDQRRLEDALNIKEKIEF